MEPSALVDRHMELDFDAVGINKVNHRLAACRPFQVQSVVIALLAALHHHQEFRLLPGERSLGPHRPYGQTRQIGIGMQGRHDKQRGEQERQCIAEVVFKVDRCYQHHQQATAKKEARSTGENENPPLVQGDFSGWRYSPIYPFAEAASNPLAHTVTVPLNAVLDAVHRRLPLSVL